MMAIVMVMEARNIDTASPSGRHKPTCVYSFKRAFNALFDDIDNNYCQIWSPLGVGPQCNAHRFELGSASRPHNCVAPLPAGGIKYNRIKYVRKLY